jgi:hypothetical protein
MVMMMTVMTMKTSKVINQVDSYNVIAGLGDITRIDNGWRDEEPNAFLSSTSKMAVFVTA